MLCLDLLHLGLVDRVFGRADGTCRHIDALLDVVEQRVLLFLEHSHLLLQLSVTLGLFNGTTTWLLG